MICGVWSGVMVACGHTFLYLTRQEGAGAAAGGQRLAAENCQRVGSERFNDCGVVNISRAVDVGGLRSRGGGMAQLQGGQRRVARCSHGGRYRVTEVVIGNHRRQQLPVGLRHIVAGEVRQACPC